jgi:hypothetical protein
VSIGGQRLRDLMARLPKGEPVPAISIRQPWATAVFLLGKDVENRNHWVYRYRGPIVIHASRAPVYREDLDAAMAIARKDGISKDILQLIKPRGGVYDLDFFPNGIVGLADLADVVGPDDHMPEDHPVAESPWAADDANYWLYFTNVAPVIPIEFRGAVGLFKVPYATVASLRPLIPD